MVKALVDVGSEYGVSAKFPTLGSLVTVVLNNAYFIAGFLIIFLLIFAGVSIIMGAGKSDSSQVEKGAKAATMAIIGFVVVFLSWFIIKIIETVTGVNILSPSGI